MLFAHLVLYSIKKSLNPTWEYYMLAKGNLREHRKYSNKFPFDISEIVNNIKSKYKVKYDCNIDLEPQIGIIGDDYITDTKTLIFKIRSIF